MKIYSREEALKKSIEYFNGDELAAEVFITKYAMRNEKLELVEASPDQMHHRLAKEFARIEKKYPNPMSEEEIFSLFDKFKYIAPQGSPMFGIGNVYQKVSLSNCFVLDVVDSYGGICRADERIAQISKRRGGAGLDISAIRPKGLSTKNSALTTDGIVVFMERFSNTAREVAQHGRRGALLLSISVHHPEILNFIRAKRDLKKVTGANISVRITDEFIKAVQKKETYEQRWPVDSDKPVIKQEVKAKEIWDELMKSSWLNGEPGILYWDTIIKNSPADSYEKDGLSTCSTNPCITGDTLVYVADGRGNVSIKQLAKEGRDIPVFCYDNNGEVAIRTMRHPRVTGYNEQIYKITIDDGYVIRCTGNHKIRMKNGDYKYAKDLIAGDSLKTIVRYESPMPKDIKKSKSKIYNWIANGYKNIKAEHRYIVENKIQRKLKKTETVHHINHNGLDNSESNLEPLSISNHSNMHKSNMIGDKNPMCRAKTEWSDEKWAQYSNNMSNAVKHEKNGRYLGITNEELLNRVIEFTKKIGRRVSTEEWQEYARKNNLVIEFSEWRKEFFGSILNMTKKAAQICGFKNIDCDPRLVRTLNNISSEGYECKIEDHKVIVKKTCEGCGRHFWVEYLKREVSYCGSTCSRKRPKTPLSDASLKNIQLCHKNRSFKVKNKQCDVFAYLKNKIARTPLRKEWENECRRQNIQFRLGTKYGFKGYRDLKEKSQYYNHRIVSVELDGQEEVYNGTVDDFHNFFIGGFESKTKGNKHKWLYINNKNCGELPLSPGASCILLLQNLTSYIKNPFSDNPELDEELLRQNTRKSQRLIDDMVDLEIEAIEKIIGKVKLDPESDDVKHNELSLWNGIRETCIKSRRTGLGITGLGDCIAMLNIKYGSKESVKIVEKIFEIIRNESYRSSIEMAKERGSFPIWDHKKEQDNKFLNRLPEDILKDMKKYGRRNIACLTVSPAGSISTLTQTTSGFEPVYMAEYVRKRKLMENDKDKPDFIDDMGDKWKNYKVEHAGLKLFKKITGKEFKDSPYFGSQAGELDYEERVKIQGIATSYIDHAISSTINLPNSVDVKTVDKLYMLAYEQGCKGLTVYRDGSRDGVLTKEASHNTRECDDCDEASKKLRELVQQGHRPTKIILSPAPKREIVMPCEIHRSKVGKGDWLFFVGMLNGQPYEVFGGNSSKFTIPQKYKTGWILKNGKNKTGTTQYHLVLGSLDDKNEKLEFKDINKHFNNREYGAFTRLVSLNMRHGTPIKYVCEQITKTGCAGDFYSFQRAMSRVLKKYIADGEKSESECPVCKSTDVIYKNGCPTCKICGNSNCS